MSATLCLLWCRLCGNTHCILTWKINQVAFLYVICNILTHFDFFWLIWAKFDSFWLTLTHFNSLWLTLIHFHSFDSCEKQEKKWKSEVSHFALQTVQCWQRFSHALRLSEQAKVVQRAWQATSKSRWHIRSKSTSFRANFLKHSAQVRVHATLQCQQRLLSRIP